MTARLHSLYRILESNRQLAGLLRRAEEDQRSFEQVRGALPPDLAGHVKGARTIEGRLVLLTESPVWASRLRYAAPTLRTALDSVGEINVKVLPSGGAAAPPKPGTRHRANTMSAQNAEHIRIMAAAIADPRLSGALLRLAKHGDEKP